MRTLNSALAIAIAAHGTQRDKAGEPYIFHPLRMALACRGDLMTKVVAILHDVVEDSDFTIHGIRIDFGDMIGDAIDALTRRKDEGYFTYISRVYQNKTATEVKLLDLDDNMNVLRLKEFSEHDAVRLRKYHRAHRILDGTVVKG